MKNTISVLIELRYFYGLKQQRAIQADKSRYVEVLNNLDDLIDYEAKKLIESLKEKKS